MVRLRNEYYRLFSSLVSSNFSMFQVSLVVQMYFSLPLTRYLPPSSPCLESAVSCLFAFQFEHHFGF
jgi:hypothetical protein